MQVVVLYVDQEESIRRQMARAKMAALHNWRAKDAGTEDLVRQLRNTDVDEAKCRSRYAVFKEHYGTLLRLKQVKGSCAFAVLSRTLHAFVAKRRNILYLTPDPVYGTSIASDFASCSACGRELLCICVSSFRLSSLRATRRPRFNATLGLAACLLTICLANRRFRSR